MAAKATAKPEARRATTAKAAEARASTKKVGVAGDLASPGDAPSNGSGSGLGQHSGDAVRERLSSHVAASGAPKAAAQPRAAAPAAMEAALSAGGPSADAAQAASPASPKHRPPAPAGDEDRPCTVKELLAVKAELAKLHKGHTEALGKFRIKVQEELRQMVGEAVRGELELVRPSIVQEAVDLAMDYIHQQLDALPLSRPPALSGGAQRGAAELEPLRLRAERAELELQAMRCELELKAIQPELALRAVRAQCELEAAVTALGKDAARFPALLRQPSAPSTPPQRMLVLGRYEVFRDEVIGQGGFSVVRRGRDVQTGAEVAVKSYWDLEEQEQPADAWIFEKFRHEIAIFQRLHTEEDLRAGLLQQKQVQKLEKRGSWYVPDGITDSSGLQVFAEVPPPSELFVRLLDFSRDASGQPGPCPGDGDMCYAVLEMADYTLHQYLESRQQSGLYMTQAEVFHVFRQLAYMILVLHSKNFVHIDLKPMNIMHFPSGHWKLIDMDGMVWPGNATACDVCYTPYYVAPEIAAQFAQGLEDVDTSRLLDVWSLGMCACELVTLSPVLEAQFTQFWHQLHEDANVRFLEWLADPANVIEVPTRIRSLDPKLADVIQRMLQKKPDERASMVEVLLHPYFTGQHIGGDWATTEKSCLDERGLVRRYLARLQGRASGLLELQVAEDTGGDVKLPEITGVHDKRLGKQPVLRRRVSTLRGQACMLQSTVFGDALGLTGVQEDGDSRSSRDSATDAIPRRSPALPASAL